jgi:hypothetical protein
MHASASVRQKGHSSNTNRVPQQQHKQGATVATQTGCHSSNTNRVPQQQHKQGATAATQQHHAAQGLVVTSATMKTPCWHFPYKTQGSFRPLADVPTEHRNHVAMASHGGITYSMGRKTEQMVSVTANRTERREAVSAACPLYLRGVRSQK